MASTDPRERQLVAQIASHSRSQWSDVAEHQERIRVARLNLKSARARRKASEWLRIAAEAEATLASGGDDVAS